MTSKADRERFRAALASGSLFEGKYRIERNIGAGSFAFVLKARHEVMDRDVALKVLKPEIVDGNPDVADRFVHEARVVSKLRHPNTVTVHDFGTAPNGLSYMVMEYVEGRPLDEVIIGDGGLSPQRVVRITKQILKSLDEAHNAGIVHRDLKPSNIMLTEVHGEIDYVKVLDFGVAKLVGDESKPKAQFERRSTQFVGTPIYMSPEQVLGETVGPSSDLYALGLIIYEMLTGDDPIDAPSVAKVAQIHIDDEPIPFRRLSELSPRFQKLILKATARQPEDRFRNVTEFARFLPNTGGADHSAEFSGLLLDNVDSDRRSAGGADEISENSWDVFSGKNYVAPPPEDRASAGEPSPRPLKPPPTRATVAVESEAIQPRPRRDLQLDVGRVRRDELRREREQPASKSNVWARKGDPLRDGGWIVGGLVAFFVSFVIASTVFVQSGGSGRTLVGMLPLGTALAATWFSPVRRIAGGFVGSYLLPFARNMCIVLVVLLLFVALVMPESAASTLDIDAAWFLEGADAEGVVRKGVEGLGHALGALFSFASRILPW